MKSILLASASVLAFAGVASAEVTFGGSATLGYNDTDTPEFVDDPSTGVVDETFDEDDENIGFYWDASLSVTLSQALDNGMMASATVGIDLTEDNTGQNLESADYLLMLESDMAAMYFGVYGDGFAAERYWLSTGEGGPAISLDMENDGFSEQDGETQLGGWASFGSFEMGVSYIVQNSDAFDIDPTVDSDADGDFLNDEDTPNRNSDDLEQLSLGARGTFGNFVVGMAYQEEIDAANLTPDGVGGLVYNDNGDISNDEIFGIFVATTFGNADVGAAYASNETTGETSSGVSISYPFGPVTVGAAYNSNSDVPDTYDLTAGYANGPIIVDAAYGDNVDGTDEEYSVDMTYSAAGGFDIFAGFSDGDGTVDTDYYVGAQVGLGEGAALTVSYAEDKDGSEEDEVGARDLQDGTTVEVGFTF